MWHIIITVNTTSLNRLQGIYFLTCLDLHPQTICCVPLEALGKNLVVHSAKTHLSVSRPVEFSDRGVLL